MILSLHIRNVALIEDLTLEFHNGLHVMTGETGAGKSIVVDAVNLVLGGRADRDLIRTGTNKASVEAVFDVSGDVEVKDYLGSEQIACEDNTVTLYRELTGTRSLCRVCGVVTPLTVLRETAARLMDVHGQHEGRFLLDPRYHLGFLDESGGEEHQKLLSETERACNLFLECHRKYARLVRENERKQFRMESLKKSLSEISRARLKPGEDEALEKEQVRLKANGRIVHAVRTAYGHLAAGEETSVLTSLKSAFDALSGIQDLDANYKSLAERTGSAYYELEEVSYELSSLLEQGDFDPKRAIAVDQKLELIRRLKKQYGDTIESILERERNMQEEYDGLEAMDEQLSQLAAEHKRLLQAYRLKAKELTASRHHLADVFEENMTHELKDLGMEHTVFRVDFAPPPAKQQLPQPLGEDTVEFMISPNPGEPLKGMSKIASGGELSRIMLAIKSLEAERGGVGCMVFDEIDTGISGRMAQVVAEKMALIARSRQVICVTHLPQIAAMADYEFLVEKHEEAGRTNTRVRLLNEEERIAEVGRMVGGTEGTDESAQSHASHMLKTASAFRAQRNKSAAGVTGSQTAGE